MNRFYFIFILFCCIFISCSTSNKNKSSISFSNKPIWADEFNIDGNIDTTKWSYEVNGDGGGNNELQYYTKGKNAIVKNGNLIIEARKENFENKNYTSCRLVTKGKADFLYGRIEARAKLSAGNGLWPAFWMMPVNENYGEWPASGEIDIMEQVGFAPDSIHISTHTKERNWMKNNGITSVALVKDACNSFHKYRIDWTPASIIGFIDDKKIFENKNDLKGNSFWPFDKPFFIILNLAIGGGWGRQKGVDEKIFPAKYEIDYVRVYKYLDK